MSSVFIFVGIGGIGCWWWWLRSSKVSHRCVPWAVKGGRKGLLWLRDRCWENNGWFTPCIGKCSWSWVAISFDMYFNFYVVYLGHLLCLLVHPRHYSWYLHHHLLTDGLPFSYLWSLVVAPWLCFFPFRERLSSIHWSEPFLVAKSQFAY